MQPVRSPIVTMWSRRAVVEMLAECPARSCGRSPASSATSERTRRAVVRQARPRRLRVRDRRSGLVRIGGREHTRLGRGEAFGEISALLGEPVSGDLVRLGPVGYIWLELERVRDFLTRHRSCVTACCREARRLLDRVAGTRASSAARRRHWTPDRAAPPGRTAARMAQRHGTRARSVGIERASPLVFGGEALTLQGELAEVAAGRAFLLLPATVPSVRRSEHRRRAQPMR